MKTIKVQDYETAPGMEYVATSYPGNGAYFNRGGNMLYMVGNGCVYSMSNPTILFSEGPASNESGTVSEVTLLKALAIAQNPSLAIELAK